MAIVLILILGIFSLGKRNSKSVMWVWGIFMWLIAAGNISSPDRYMYKIIYSTPEISNKYELFFSVLVRICNWLGLDFGSFLGICFAIGLFFLINAISKMSNSKSWVLFIVFLWPFILDVEQIRSFIGTSIVLYGFSYLYNKKYESMWKNILMYIIFCLVASMFQTSCLFYALYAFIFLSPKMIKIVTSILLVLVIFFRNFLLNILSILMGTDVSNKAAGFLSGTESKENWYIYVLYNISIILIVIFLCKKNEIEQRKLILKINMLSLVLIPFLIINPNFERLFRLIIIIDYIVIGNLIGTKIKYYREVFLLLTVVGFASARFLALALGAGWDNYFVPYFFDNTFLNF